MTVPVPAGPVVGPSRLDDVCVEVTDVPGQHNWWCPTAPQARAMAMAYARALGPDWTVDHDTRPRPHYHVARLVRRPDGSVRSQRLSGHFFYGGRRPYRIRPRDRGRGLRGELGLGASGTWRRVGRTIVLDGVD